MSEGGIAPCEVRRERDLLRLDRSGWDGKDYWMLIQHDGAVIIHKQRNGEPTTEQITIPRRTFLAMLDWYQKQQ